MSDTINRARKLAERMADNDVVSFYAVSTVIRELCDELESESCEVSDLKLRLEIAEQQKKLKKLESDFVSEELAPESKCDHEMVTTGSGTYCMKPDCDVNWL